MTTSEKWRVLRRLARNFRHIPFADFALVAGSMAMGNATETSDFDIIVGARTERIFTVRFIAAMYFGILGVRRKRNDSKEESRNKICLNHFVTPKGYLLSPPYNEYWIRLYKSLVPVYGSREKVEAFFMANAGWSGCVTPPYDRMESSVIKRITEKVLGGKLGNAFEKICKRYQVRRIEKHLSKELGYKPQVKYDDTELRFHMDTKRIEEWLWYNKHNNVQS